MALIFEDTATEFLTVFALALFLVYYLLTSSFNYWKDRGVPFLPPEPVFGNVRNLILHRTSFAQEYQRLYRASEGHPYFGFFQSARPVLMIRDPELIRCVLVKDFVHFPCRKTDSDEKTSPLSANLFSLDGRRWRALRAKLTPAFTSGRMKEMFVTVSECAMVLQRAVGAQIGDGPKVVDVREVFNKYSTDVISSCAFGLQLNTQNDENELFRVMGKKMTFPSRTRVILRFLAQAFPVLEKRIKVNVIDSEITEFVTKVVKDTVDYRIKNNVTRKDFLQLLIQLKQKGKLEEDKGKPPLNGNNEMQSADDDIEFTDEFLAAQCFIFYVAGFETSSTVMGFCLLELAVDQEVQNLLREEIDKAMKANDGKITYESVMTMPYLDKVVAETLRKYPAVPFLDRVCKKAYDVPNHKFRIEQDLRVVIPIQAIHNDPLHYPNPEKFDPERFSDGNRLGRQNKYTYLPFGDGPRNCIGMRFGLMQSKLGISYLLSKYRFLVSDETEYPPTMKSTSTFLTPVRGIPLMVCDRWDNNTAST